VKLVNKSIRGVKKRSSGGEYLLAFGVAILILTALCCNTRKGESQTSEKTVEKELAKVQEAPDTEVSSVDDFLLENITAGQTESFLLTSPYVRGDREYLLRKHLYIEQLFASLRETAKGESDSDREGRLRILTKEGKSYSIPFGWKYPNASTLLWIGNAQTVPKEELKRLFTVLATHLEHRAGVPPYGDLTTQVNENDCLFLDTAGLWNAASQAYKELLATKDPKALRGDLKSLTEAMFIYRRLVEVLTQSGQFESALRYIDEYERLTSGVDFMIKDEEETVEKYFAACAQWDRAEVYRAMKEYDKAIVIYKERMNQMKGLPIASFKSPIKRDGMRFADATFNNLIGYCLQLKGDYDGAVSYYSAILRKWTERKILTLETQSEREVAHRFLINVRQQIKECQTKKADHGQSKK